MQYFARSDGAKLSLLSALDYNRSAIAISFLLDASDTQDLMLMRRNKRLTIEK